MERRTKSSSSIALKLIRLYTISLLILSILLLSGCSKKEAKSTKGVPVKTYLKRLKSDKDKTREKAVEAIGKIGAPATPHIIKAWKRAEPPYIYELCKALHKIGPGASDAVPLLVKALDDINEDMLFYAALALSGIGPAAAPAVPKLSPLLRASDTSTQVNVIKALGNIGAASAPAIPDLMKAALREKTQSVAIIALAQIGPKAVEAMDEWLESDDPHEVFTACEVLAEAGQSAEKSLPALTKVFKSKNAKVRKAAARAIGKAGPAAVKVIDELIDALDDRDKEVREVIIAALVDMGPDAGPKMVAEIKHRSPLVREGVVRVIGSFSSVRDGAMDKLIGRMSDSNVDVQMAAINAIALAGKPIVPRMINLLKSKDFDLRFGAARVLGILGSDAREAVPELLKLKKDKDSLVREEAERALNLIMG